MNIEIYLNDQKLDMENISLTDFNEELQLSKYMFSQTEFDFSSIPFSFVLILIQFQAAFFEL